MIDRHEKLGLCTSTCRNLDFAGIVCPKGGRTERLRGVAALADLSSWVKSQRRNTECETSERLTVLDFGSGGKRLR
jgi:hypothetical protein